MAKKKIQYRMMNVREAIALAEAGVQGIEVKQRSRAWIAPHYLYESSSDDEDYLRINQDAVYRVAVE